MHLLIASLGNVVTVESGRMRNILYPKQAARYISADELRELKKTGVVFERDLDFGVNRSKDEPISEVSTDRIVEAPDVRAQLLTVRPFPNVTTTSRNANGYSARERN